MSLKADAAHQHVWTLDTVKSLRPPARPRGRGRSGRAPVQRSRPRAVRSLGRRWAAAGRRRAVAAVAQRGRAGRRARGRAGRDGRRVGAARRARRGAPGRRHPALRQRHRLGRTRRGQPGRGARPVSVHRLQRQPRGRGRPGAGGATGRAPAWWNFDVGSAEGEVEVVDGRGAKRRKKPPPDNQLALLGVAPPPPVAAIAAAVGRVAARGVAALDRAGRPPLSASGSSPRSSSCVARNGVADAAAFAAELGEFAARVERAGVAAPRGPERRRLSGAPIRSPEQASPPRRRQARPAVRADAVTGGAAA
jgi:hypothetical protein